jgi:hypothetical protein
MVVAAAAAVIAVVVAVVMGVAVAEAVAVGRMRASTAADRCARAGSGVRLGV